MDAKDITLPCPFCGDDVSVTLGPDAFVGEAWWGRCECGASYSCGPDGSPGFGWWTPPGVKDCPSCGGPPKASASAKVILCGWCGADVAPWPPKGEPCGAADHEDGEPDAYEVWNATGEFPK